MLCTNGQLLREFGSSEHESSSVQYNGFDMQAGLELHETFEVMSKH